MTPRTHDSWAHTCRPGYCCLHSSFVSPEAMSGIFGNSESILREFIVGISICIFITPGMAISGHQVSTNEHDLVRQACATRRVHQQQEFR